MNYSYDSDDATKDVRRRVALFAILLFTIFVILYSVFALLSPREKIASINSEYSFKPNENSETDIRILTDSAFIALNREKAWLQSRITMAETDSVSLSLNLSDSLAILEINGVAVYTSGISSYSMSKVFHKADEYAISSLLSFPFTIKSDISSIEKEPLMHKIAPKDTSEYKPAEIPDTAKVESVNFILEMENGFRVYVYQEPDNEKGTGFKSFLFDISDRFRNSLYITKSIFSFEVPDYKPFIKVTLPGGDARIIYRALPVNGQVAIRR
jgi:hypothetical protein